MQNSMNYSLQEKRILIIEDDKTLSDLIAGLLREAGYLVRQCFDGATGLKTAKIESFNLVLLDVMLPKMDGFSVLNKLRQRNTTPVIMLTARGAEEDRITGFKTGADDYLPKPFNLDELILRIEAVIRRSYALFSQLNQQEPTPTLYNIGALQLDTRNNTAMFQQESIELTDMEFRLLTLLAKQHGDILSKPYLYNELMGRPYSRNERSLDVHVSKLRRKLKNAGCLHDCIQTVHGKGYRLK